MEIIALILFVLVALVCWAHGVWWGYTTGYAAGEAGMREMVKKNIMVLTDGGRSTIEKLSDFLHTNS